MPESNQGFRKQSLTAVSIAPADSVVITISDVREVDVPDDERASGQRAMTVLEMYEFPDHVYWLKPAGRSIVRLQHGANIAKWIGKKIPLMVEAVPNPRTNEVVDVLNVAKLRDWESILFASSRGRPRATATSEPNAARRPRAKRKALKK